MIAWKGLRFSHIERGNCDPIILKSFYECIVIDHTSARQIDQYGGSLHSPELISTNHISRFLSQRHIQSDKIRLFEQIVERYISRAQLDLRFGIWFSVVIEHIHVKSLCPSRDLPADIAHTNNTQCRTVDFVTDQNAWIVVRKRLTAGKTVANNDIAGGGHKHCKSHIGCCAIEHIGRIAHWNPALFGC